MDTCLLAISEGKSGIDPPSAYKKDATHVSGALDSVWALTEKFYHNKFIL